MMRLRDVVLFGLCTTPLTAGVLAVHPGNPRWFTDGSGRALYLGGHQVFVDLQDRSFNKAFTRDGQRALDWPSYVRFLREQHFNYLRNWVIWSTGSGTQAPVGDAVAGPMPFRRVSGHGRARDGGGKFDLERFNEAFFQRLRQRCADLQGAGVYVSVMLFEVYGFLRGEAVGDPPQTLWDGNLCNGANNINGIDMDPEGQGHGMAFFYTEDPRVLELQRRYVRKVVDTLNDLDNVFYEIANELEAPAWQEALVAFIHDYERRLPKQHLVLMSAGGRTRAGRWRQRGYDPVVGSRADCFAVSGHWRSGRFKRKDPPANDSGKPGIVDTDHVAPGTTDVGYVWSALTRGYHVNLYDRPFERPAAEGPDWILARRSVGQAVRYTERLDLARLSPRGDLVSTGFCLAEPGVAYLVYQPDDGPITVSGLARGRVYDGELYDAKRGTVVDRWHVRASGTRETFASAGRESVLRLRVRPGVGTPERGGSREETP